MGGGKKEKKGGRCLILRWELLVDPPFFRKYGNFLKKRKEKKEKIILGDLCQGDKKHSALCPSERTRPDARDERKKKKSKKRPSSCPMKMEENAHLFPTPIASSGIRKEFRGRGEGGGFYSPSNLIHPWAWGKRSGEVRSKEKRRETKHFLSLQGRGL